MEQFEFGSELAVNCWLSSMVSSYNLKKVFIDQKKDIVGLFPDAKQPHLIHSASIDRSISTYDLKQEKSVNWRQISNGTHWSMS